jgi:hypothetical protein
MSNHTDKENTMTHSKQAEQAKQNYASAANRTYSASKVA